MTLEEARVFFAGDRFATETTGIGIDAIGPGYAKCSLLVEERHLAAYGQVMGGAIFTLADFCFAVATNHEADVKTVSMSSNINFLTRARDNQLFAETKCLKDGKRSCFYLVTVTDGLGTEVASVNINGIHL